MRTLSSVIRIALLLSCINAHSWLECTNYDPPAFDIDHMGDFDRSKCHGYPRNFQNQYNSGFGVDSNYQWMRNDCSRDVYVINDYTPSIPMATYIAGEIIYLIHPSKQHVADVCTDSNIPSHSIKLFASSNTSEDLFDIEIPLLGKDHENGIIDHLGYQHCHNFCNNTDKATCMTAWILPDNVSHGIHSFRWTWEMIPGEYSSTCFDAFIVHMDDYSNDTNEIIFNETVSNDTIKLESAISLPTPDPTHNIRHAKSVDSSGSSSRNTEIHIEVGNSKSTESSSFADVSHSINKPTPQVITSDAHRLSSPLVNISKYIIDISENVSDELVLNITKLMRVLALL